MKADTLTTSIEKNIKDLIEEEDMKKGIKTAFIHALASAIIEEITERGSVIFSEDKVEKIKAPPGGGPCSGTLKNGKIQ